MGKEGSSAQVFLLCVIIALIRTQTSAVAVNTDVAETNTNTAASSKAEDKPLNSHLEQSQLHAVEQVPHTTSLHNDGQENPSPDRTSAEEGHGVGQSESVTNQEDKGFMKGTGQYLYAFQSNTGKTENEDTPAEKQGSNFKRKQDESAFLPFENMDDTDKEGDSESGSDVKDDEKRFMKGFETYLHKPSGNTLGVDSDPQDDKRFMRGFESYMKPKGKKDDVNTEEGFGSFSGENKRFMKGFKSYMKPQVGKRDDAEEDFDGVASSDKRFMRSFAGYMKPQGNRENIRGNTDSDKRFMKGFQSYMQKPKSGNLGKTDDENNDENSNDLNDKRFMKGFEMYLPKREPTKWQANDVNKLDLQFAPTDKRFMKGVNWYIQQHSNDNLRSQRVKRSEDTSIDWYTDSLDNSEFRDKRFLKGINPYLQMYASSLPSKRFLKGINPYLLAYTGYPSKRFLKGIDPYLQIYSSGRLSKRFMRIPSLQTGGRQWEARPSFTKRSGFGDSEEYDAEPYDVEDLETDKRFMRGYEHYIRPKSKGRITSKRFMKGVNPYLHMFLHPLDDKKSDMDDADGGLRDKRFLKGINPYLQMYANRFQDSKRYGGGWYESSLEKRFMKGINPYLQMYTTTPQEFQAEAPEKRFIKGPLLDMYISRLQGKRVRRASEGNSAEKRFLKGANPSQQMYSSNTPDVASPRAKRSMKGIDGYLMNRPQREASSSDKRFLKGVDHYIMHYANHPRVKRDVGNGASGNADDVSGPTVNATPEKRFLKGINPYLQIYAGQPGDKKNEAKESVTDKRFMKGVNEYIQSYANRPEVKRQDDSGIPSDKRFMKGIDSYLQKYSKQAQGKRQEAGGAETSDIQDYPPKRFMKGINLYLQNNANTKTDKRFFKEVDPYLTDYANFQTSKRFMRGFEHYLHKPQPKRFMKGLHAYIKNYPRQPQGKRSSKKVSKEQYGDSSEASALKPDASFVSGFAELASLQSPDEDKTPDKKFMKGVNHYIQMHDSQVRTKRQADRVRTKRQADQVWTNDIFEDDDRDRTEWRSSELDLPPEKRFLKGVNSYLRHYANYERPTRSDYDDIETAIGDSLAVQLADTAQHMMNKREHYRHNPHYLWRRPKQATWPNTNTATWLWMSGAHLPTQDTDEDNKDDEFDEDTFQPHRQVWRGPHQSTVFDNSRPWFG